MVNDTTKSYTRQCEEHKQILVEHPLCRAAREERAHVGRKKCQKQLQEQPLDRGERLAAVSTLEGIGRGHFSLPVAAADHWRSRQWRRILPGGRPGQHGALLFTWMPSGSACAEKPFTTPTAYQKVRSPSGQASWLLQITGNFRSPNTLIGARSGSP